MDISQFLQAILDMEDRSDPKPPLGPRLDHVKGQIKLAIELANRGEFDVHATAGSIHDDHAEPEMSRSEKVRKLIEEGYRQNVDKVGTIKLVRDFTGWTPSEAKWAVDQVNLFSWAQESYADFDRTKLPFHWPKS